MQDIALQQAYPESKKNTEIEIPLDGFLKLVSDV